MDKHSQLIYDAGIYNFMAKYLHLLLISLLPFRRLHNSAGFICTASR